MSGYMPEPNGRSGGRGWPSGLAAGGRLCALAHASHACHLSCASRLSHPTFLLPCNTQDGYFTLLGEGSGTCLSPAGLLQLAVARALLRRPALLLLEDYDAFAEALGEERLQGLLRRLRGGGACVVVVAGHGRAAGVGAGAVERGQVRQDAKWDWADVHAHLHGGTLDSVTLEGGAARGGSGPEGGAAASE